MLARDHAEPGGPDLTQAIGARVDNRVDGADYASLILAGLRELVVDLRHGAGVIAHDCVRRTLSEHSHAVGQHTQTNNVVGHGLPILCRPRVGKERLTKVNGLPDEAGHHAVGEGHYALQVTVGRIP